MPKKRPPAATAPSAYAEVGAAEFKARCLELIDRVSEARAEYVVTKHGRPVARLVPVSPTTGATPFGTMNGTVLQFDRPYDPVPALWSVNADDPSDD